MRVLQALMYTFLQKSNVEIELGRKLGRKLGIVLAGEQLYLKIENVIWILQLIYDFFFVSKLGNRKSAL